jgi:hypothetical protein
MAVRVTNGRDVDHWMPLSCLIRNGSDVRLQHVKGRRRWLRPDYQIHRFGDPADKQAADEGAPVPKAAAAARWAAWATTTPKRTPEAKSGARVGTH